MALRHRLDSPSHRLLGGEPAILRAERPLWRFQLVLDAAFSDPHELCAFREERDPGADAAIAHCLPQSVDVAAAGSLNCDSVHRAAPDPSAGEPGTQTRAGRGRAWPRVARTGDASLRGGGQVPGRAWLGHPARPPGGPSIGRAARVGGLPRTTSGSRAMAL